MNRLDGIAIDGTQLWAAEQLNFTYDNVWIGTARDLAGLARHTDIRSAIQFYLTRCPDTDTIRAVINGDYRLCVPGQAAMSIIDAIMAELDVKQEPST